MFGNLIVRVAVCVDGPVKLLKGHESVDEGIVGVEQAAQILLLVYVMNLPVKG